MLLLLNLEYGSSWFSGNRWKVGGVWNTTQRAELTERMKRLRATNTQPDNSTLRRMEGQEMTHLRQQLREMTRQKDAVIQRNEREIERNTETIQRNAETIQQKETIIRTNAQALQQKEATIQRNERELERNAETIQQKETTIRTNAQALQQKEATIQRNERELERNAETIQQKETTIRTNAQALQQKEATIQRNERELERNAETIQQKETTIRTNTQTLQQNEATIHQLQSDIREKDLQIQQKNDVIQRHEGTITQQRRVITGYRDNPSWLIERDEIIVTGEVLGKGGWGEVKVGVFRGTRVAVKTLYEVIVNDYYLQLFSREMDVASRVRHPNLLQFIGATKVGQLMIITELMPTSLRRELEKHSLLRSQVISIATNVVSALNYLHSFRPRPILHRDVSSANVLLEPSVGNNWKGKLSDYGSANLMDNITNTSNPGSPVYSAPEASTPSLHSAAMDIYSFGILLLEMATDQFPSTIAHEREGSIQDIKWSSVKELVIQCTSTDPSLRPPTDTVLTLLRDLK